MAMSTSLSHNSSTPERQQTFLFSVSFVASDDLPFIITTDVLFSSLIVTEEGKWISNEEEFSNSTWQ